MKQILLFASLFALVACSTVKKDHAERKVAAETKDLTGNYVGVADYGKGTKGPNKKAVRIYLHPIEGRPGSYDVVFLEYVNLIKMAPKYITSNKIRFLAKLFGFLKDITKYVVAYEAVPGAQENTLELRPLVVSGDRIVTKEGAAPRILTLSPDAPAKNPLAGATLSSTLESDPEEVFFPKDGDGEKKTGHQYKLAKFVYEKVKLESTWRKNFLNGPYLSQYYKRDDVVLKLRNGSEAEFVESPKYDWKSEKKRRAMFTNPASGFLRGRFTVTEPRDGMFLFRSVDADPKSKEVVEGKIGLFIDIFDATKSLNQDVVELTMIDSEDRENFLMYYEDPKNGEGEGPVAQPKQ